MAMHSKLGRDARLDLAGPCDETVLLAAFEHDGDAGEDARARLTATEPRLL